MSYRTQLQQARQFLEQEIQELQLNLVQREQELRKLDGLLKERGERRGKEPSLTSQIVTTLYQLMEENTQGVPARLVVKQFGLKRDDVNESTIRSTLYQVTRKIRPTEITVDDEVRRVKVLKDGPLYNVELITKQEAELI